ncbi:MAG: CpaF family protein [Candidatus Omnitrophota bacterium]
MQNTLKDQIKKKIVAAYSALASKEKIDPLELKERISMVLEEILKQHDYRSISEEEKNRITQELIDELTGYGPLEKLLQDPRITEIMVNGPKKIYAEKDGKRTLTGITFEDSNQLMYLIHKMLALTRRHVDEFNPYTEVGLQDGSRANIVIPPLALDGPILTIRKFLKEINTVEDLINLGTLDRRMADFLIGCIRARVNIIFSGATGCGKTTTLNVLSSAIPNEDRIITIEDTAELRMNQEHVVRMEARQKSVEGKGEISIREIFTNSLRMRPDRVIIGEIRGAEALDMLQAICSGHTGSLAVLHANSPKDVIYRMETMILTSGIPISLQAIHRQIATSINLIVQQEQLLDGSRKITNITQVGALKGEEFTLEDIFVYEMEGIAGDGKVKGAWHATGVLPSFYNLFTKAGVTLPKEMFNKG